MGDRPPEAVQNPRADKYSDKGTTNVRLSPSTKAVAMRRAKEERLKLNAYIDRLILRDNIGS